MSKTKMEMKRIRRKMTKKLMTTDTPNEKSLAPVLMALRLRRSISI
jgi:hypothetical protein